MKKIVYTKPDGGVAVTTPAEGARLARSMTLADGTVLSAEAPQPVELFLHRWPVVGAIADWWETEDQFLARIQSKDVPVGAATIILDELALPADRSQRAGWVISGSAVVVDAARLQQAKDTRAAACVDGVDRLQFDVLVTQENNVRALRALINTLLPGSFTAGQAAQITQAQYRSALIARYKALNP
jgi:hypothetical protein